MADPYGMADDFLDGFDVDAAVRSAPAGKRARTDAAAAAGADADAGGALSPFAPGSRFSTGTTADAGGADYPKPEEAGAGAGGGFWSPKGVASVAKAPRPAAPPSQAGEEAVPGRSLAGTLERYFGFSAFREGQLEAISALVGAPSSSPAAAPRDVAVFWSTGSGKSLCYQIPPLHLGRIAVVVSPLISLMEDQVHKLNGLLGTDLAVFLGSGQMDSMAEERAMAGEYSLVYVTPEKLCSGNFLDRLGRLHASGGGGGGGGGRICLIAVDEAHCVSEWGVDFRPEYRRIGEAVRSHPALSQIPLLALTATAVPRVRDDILASLRMAPDTRVIQQSFDRENLAIEVRRKPSTGGSYRTALRPLVDELLGLVAGGSAASGSSGGASTIIYCPTKQAVDDISRHLSQQFAAAGSNVRAQPYHAGLDAASRTDAHTNFLVGRTQVVVATVAFGMGIDKPDTRRVVHWGAPKTVEEYYQQIGRAGRDGLPATALMFADDSDFSRYKSSFYLGNLTAAARAATERSIDALRAFAMDGEACRRATLLRFFEEEPNFGERCGTCDTCRDRARHADDRERDFGEDGARLVLGAVDALKDQALGTVEKVLNGNVVETYRYRYGAMPDAVRDGLVRQRASMAKKRPTAFFRELVPALVSRGYLIKGESSSQRSGSSYSNTWTTYNIAPRGKRALENASEPIILPVPASLRDVEQIEEEKRQKTLSQLKDAGYDLDRIPQAEIEVGDGEVIRALKQWHNYIDGLRRRESFDRVKQLDDLKSRIEAWRSDMAQKFRMAPASVMEEHLVVKISYVTASLPNGSMIDRDVLHSAGVRSRGLDNLSEALSEWISQTRHSNGGAGGNSTVAPSSSGKMVFPPGYSYTAPCPWNYAAYKPNKKTGLATWESSYNRFTEGEHPAAIAMNPVSGRAITVNTVIKHILDGLVLGRPVHLGRLADVAPAPNREEWEMLCKCEDVTAIDVTGDPSTSGADGGAFRMTDLLLPVMGNEFAAKDYKDRTEEEKATFGRWCGALNWFLALRRANYTPSFE